MRFSDPIYPITDTGLSGLSHTEQVKRLIGAGVGIIQLREKRMSPRAFADDARSALDIARHSGVKIIINDRVDIVMALRADGVHLGQTDLSPAEARKLLGKDAIIGFSTHNSEQAAAAVGEPIDYVAVGPVFSTSTKENPDEVLGIVSFLKIRAIVKNLPLVAIGGIGLANIGSVSGAGADAAAMIGSIFVPEHGIESAIGQLRDAWDVKIV